MSTKFFKNKADYGPRIQKAVGGAIVPHRDLYAELAIAVLNTRDGTKIPPLQVMIKEHRWMFKRVKGFR